MVLARVIPRQPPSSVTDRSAVVRWLGAGRCIRNAAARGEGGSVAKRVWTIDEVRRLGMATDVETAASILRIGRTTAYKLVGEGDFPVPVLRVGKRYVIAVENLLTLLGVDGSKEDQ